MICIAGHRQSIKSRKILPIFILMSLIFTAGCSSMGKTPEPSWRSVRKDGNIEIREYDPMIVAEVTTSGERYAAINDGFRILAAYIFGNNTAQRKIEMTAPVTQQAESQKIPMTAPAMQEAVGKNGEWKTRFIMPKNFTLATLPKPKDNRIHISEIPAFKTAVIRFSGFNTDNNIAKHQAQLITWLEKNGIQIGGVPTYAFYNPPWTPPFMKRNEVMFMISK